MRTTAMILGAAALTASAAAPAFTQRPSSPAPPGTRGYDGSRTVFGVNVLTSAIGAGVLARMSGHSFWRAAAVGAGGGALGFAGKRLAVQRFDGAGLLGRQVASVGASVAQNAVAGRGPLDRVAVPLWLGRIYIERGGERSVHARLDLVAAVLTTAAILDDGAHFDFGRTLSTGAPVFLQESATPLWRGAQLAGVVWIEDRFGPDELVGTLAHEMVHVLQHDGAFTSWTELPEQHVMARLPGFRRVAPWMDVGVHSGVRAALNRMIGYESRPWEWEAQLLSGTGGRAH